MTACGNGNFDPGIDQSEWRGINGFLHMGGTLFNTTGIYSGPINSPIARQTVVGPGGYDPVLGGTILPLSPPGGGRAVRLGNTSSDGECDGLVKIFTVTPENKHFSFWYAAVLNDAGGHGGGIPFFTVRAWIEAPTSMKMFPGSGWLPIPNPVDLGGGSSQIFADEFNPILQKKAIPGGTVFYRTWSCAQMDLSSLIGKKVKIEFIAADCSAGGHFGYAYIGSVCGSCFGDTAGSIAYNAKGSQPCGQRGKICFNYTLPGKPAILPKGKATITLAVLQNGVQVGTLNSGALTSGDSYCFEIDAAAIPGLDLSLGGFDFKASAAFSYQNFTPAPKVVGQLPDGVQSGLNNDYSFKCQSHTCCPGDNLIVNGDFEAGAIGNSRPPVWPGLGSQYGAASQAQPGSVAPGQFHIVTGAGAAAINPQWNVVDQFTCNAHTGRFMVVNGLTGQPAGTTRTVWKQTVAVTPGAAYRFCVNARHLPISHFSVQPKIEVRFTGPNNQPIASIPPTPLVISTNACDWQLLSANLTPGAGVSAVTIDIRVDESGQGNGNDFALDDLSLQQKPPVNPALLAVTFATTPTAANGHYQIKAFYPPTLPPHPQYGYLWKVSEIRPSDGAEVPGTTIFNPPVWWTYMGPTPPGQFLAFNGYQGTTTLASSGGRDQLPVGQFREGRHYRITFAVWSDCEGPSVASWDFHRMPGPTPPPPKPSSATRASDLKFDFPLLQPHGRGAAVRDPARGVGTPPPGAVAAARLPRAEEDRTVEIAVAKPSVSPGDRAPDFTVIDARGARWRLSELRGKKNVLLTFFPRCFTGGCATHLAALRDRSEELDAADIQVIAVSVDPAEGEQGQLAFAQRWQLAFPLIPDTDRRLGKLFGAIRTDQQLAARMSVFIDKEGIVRFVDTAIDVANHGADVLARVRALGKNK